MSLLTVEGLNLSFRAQQKETQILHGISFRIEKGEMLALVGESGSGKSLCALSCMRLLPANAELSGRIQFDQAEVLTAGKSQLRDLRGGEIGMVFQEPMSAFNPLHTVGRQIEEMLILHQPMLKAKDRQARIHELLELVGMAHFRDRLDAYPHQLSGGERQRMMIAMAIANQPQLLIADEPTTAVDVTVQVHILKMLKDLQHRLGMSMLFITHDLTLVRNMADRVAVMKDGKIVETGHVSEVFSNPTHAYTKHLLASEPKGMPPYPPDRPTPLIESENLRVHFPIRRGVLRRAVDHVKAVDGVSLSLPRGTTLGLVGESGSGKSTLGFALLRLLPSEGRIVFLGDRIDGIKGKHIKPLRRNMQVVFQDPYGSLNPRMTVEQIIAEGLQVHESQLSAAECAERVEESLREVGLSVDMKHRYPHEFSGGQRQRISIARAMILKPRFIVLDEPTSALDLSVQAQIVELLKKFQQKYGLTYLFISHDLRVVRAVSHRIAVMKQGRIVEENDTYALFNTPREEYTKTLIKAAMIK